MIIHSTINENSACATRAHDTQIGYPWRRFVSPPTGLDPEWAFLEPQRAALIGPTLSVVNPGG